MKLETSLNRDTHQKIEKIEVSSHKGHFNRCINTTPFIRFFQVLSDLWYVIIKSSIHKPLKSACISTAEIFLGKSGSFDLFGETIDLIFKLVFVLFSRLLTLIF